MTLSISATIVAGGNNKEGAVLSVDLLLADGTLWCNLPSLPEALYSHAQSGVGLEFCGGDSCITLTNGQWKTSRVLSHDRSYGPSSWSSDQHGKILIGGDFDSSTRTSTTERLLDNGQSEESFTLNYSRM